MRIASGCATKRQFIVDAGAREVVALIPAHAISLDVSDAKRLKSLESENARLKKLLAEAMLDNEALKVAVRGKL